jgi:hypothetical protein
MNFRWVVLDSQDSVVGRHTSKKLAEKNCRYAGDHVMPYNRKYAWGADYQKDSKRMCCLDCDNTGCMWVRLEVMQHPTECKGFIVDKRINGGKDGVV